MLEISFTDDGHIHLDGRFDASEAGAARTAFDRIQKSTVVDCSKLVYISSAGLGVLVATYRRLNETGENLTLRHLSQPVRNVFRLSGLDRLFKIE
jgi:anti-sigma B factor antagonist